jgi:hypothetical protein
VGVIWAESYDAYEVRVFGESAVQELAIRMALEEFGPAKLVHVRDLTGCSVCFAIEAVFQSCEVGEDVWELRVGWEVRGKGFMV